MEVVEGGESGICLLVTAHVRWWSRCTRTVNVVLVPNLLSSRRAASLAGHVIARGGGGESSNWKWDIVAGNILGVASSHMGKHTYPAATSPEGTQRSNWKWDMFAGDILGVASPHMSQHAISRHFLFWRGRVESGICLLVTVHVRWWSRYTRTINVVPVSPESGLFCQQECVLRCRSALTASCEAPVRKGGVESRRWSFLLQSILPVAAAQSRRRTVAHEHLDVVPAAGRLALMSASSIRHGSRDRRDPRNESLKVAGVDCE